MSNLPTLLVVDDEVHICRALGRLLRGRFRVVGAGDYDQALAALEAEAPVAAIVDYNLPGPKGDDVLRALRARRPEMRRVLLTGAPPPHVDALVAEGLAERVFTKPWSSDELIAFLNAPPG